jgi:hypothetical protein
MQILTNNLIRIACLPILFGLLAGCSSDTTEPGKIIVSGRVTNAGEPLHVEGRDVGIGVVRIAFYQIKDGKQRAAESAYASADVEGRFQLGDGIDSGEYRISIEQWDPYPNVDRLKGKFNAKNSPIVHTFNENEQLELDISEIKD